VVIVTVGAHAWRQNAGLSFATIATCLVLVNDVISASPCAYTVRR
jgi:hypothetical protein